MKYQVGDKIILLYSDEEGEVIDIINDKMVMINVRGVKFPAYLDQIDFPYFKMFTQKKVVEKKKIFIDNVPKEKGKIKKKTEDGVFLNFIPVLDKDVFDDDIVEKLKIYLINHNEEAYQFQYDLVFNGKSNFELKSKIEGLSEFYLHDINFDDVSDNPRFEFEFSLDKQQKKKADYYEAGLKVSGKKFFRRIEEIRQNNEASFRYELFKTYPDKTGNDKLDLNKLGKSGFRVYDVKDAKEYLPPARSVIDLHIEKIMEGHHKLSKAEILDIQLKEFEKYFGLAIAHHQKEFIVIHGVGGGKLRDEIHEILKTRKEVKFFVNQYHHLYGFGATEIFFK